MTGDQGWVSVQKLAVTQEVMNIGTHTEPRHAHHFLVIFIHPCSRVHESSHIFLQNSTKRNKNQKYPLIKVREVVI